MNHDIVSPKKSWLKAAIVGLIFIATEFCGGQFIFQISVRNIVLILITFYLFVNPYKQKREILSVKILIAYYLFVAFLGLLNDFYSTNGLQIIITRFGATIVIFFFLMSFIKTKQELETSVYVFLIILIINSVATILQGTDSPLGWLIASTFKSPEGYEEMLTAMESDATSIGHSVASGFSETVVGNGYLLGSIGLLLLLPVFWKQNIYNVVFAIFCTTIFVVALFYCQQRAAFYVFIVALITIFISHLLLKRKYISFIIILVVSLIGLSILFNNDTSIMNDDMGRLSKWDSEVREYNQTIYWRDFFYDNLWLGNRTKFVQLYGTTPHSLPIETLLFGGIIGLFIMSAFVFSLFGSILKHAYNRNVEIFLMGGPIISMFLISFTHSSGFHSGHTLCAYILALYYLSIQFFESKKIQNVCKP